jgi:hypothetical protein
MPVSQLLVEGRLDADLLRPVFQGRPTVDFGGSKYSLSPRARIERQRSGANVWYLRDRDFDYPPPSDLSQPVVDHFDRGTILGWHWCRHEIENYLLEPVMVATAMGWDMTTYRAELTMAARRIRHYQAARWAVGIARRSLPPNYELETKPAVCAGHDFRLPDDLSESTSFQWARDQVGDFQTRVNQVLGRGAVDNSLSAQAGIFTDAFLSSITEVLVWFSGKDLLAALEAWLQAQGLANAGDFRARMRAWVQTHPDEALNHLAEWNKLRDLLRA